MTEFSIGPYDPVERDEVLAVINEAFDFPRTRDWFTWKHLDGPWGPSRGVVARDGDGIIGVRLLLPWRFRRDDTEVEAFRAVEASTLPRARGRGVFSALNQALMDGLRDRTTFVFSTPNALSRGGYRKLGWTWLEPVPHLYQPAPLARRTGTGGVVVGLEALASYTPSRDASHLRTNWSPESLAWRLDPRTGNEYQAVAAQVDGALGGVVYRRLQRGRFAVLMVLEGWGPEAARRGALAHATRSTGCRLLLTAASGRPGGPRLGVRRGSSLLTYWSAEPDLERRLALGDVANWSTSFADLESVL